jgi:hypothetical protein
MLAEGWQMSMQRFFWLSAAVLGLTACDHSYVESAQDDKAARETREVGEFDSIEVDGYVRLEVDIGTAQEVVLRGQPRVIERTRTTVTGSTLRIAVERKDWTWGKERRRLIVKISVPRLRTLELDGGNDVRLQGFNGGDSTINVRGAARIRGSGELDRLTIYMAGAGHADFGRLVANDAKVTVDGVGSVFVHPKQSLDATMNGVGAILYSGSPRVVNSSMNGVGTISKRNKDDGPPRSGDAASEQEEEDLEAI